MSSNTLRGIGQEGDGEGGDGQKADAGTPTTAAGQTGSAPAAPKGAPDGKGTGTDRMPELRKIRSLDSTVPGTRSLDSSVPEAQPSLDGKVPSLAATMLGMTAPNIPGRDGGGADGARDKGTVQGRDVHLPVELQRRAGSMPIPGVAAPRAEAAPQSVDYSEPTIADPVRVEHGTPEMNSHGPWYEQEPVGADTYDDPKPSMIGRVAIGAAVAASLAVVLFAIVRVRVQNQAAAEAEAAMPVRVSPPPSSINVAPSPTLGTTPTAAPSIPDEPPMPSEPAAGLDQGLGAGLAPSVPTPGTSRPSAYRPGASAGGYQPPRPTNAGAKTATVAPLPNSLIRPKALGEAPSETTPAAPTAPPPVAATPELSTPAATTPPALPAEAPAAEAKPASPASPPGAETPAAEAKPAAPAKSKKKTDDPDSTLPLNLD